MILTKINRITGLGLVNAWRNRWLSIPAIFIITLTLTMMGTFIALSIFANATSEALKDKVTVQVDFNDSATEADIQGLQKALSAQAGVIATYISKEDALADFKSRSDIKQSTRDIVSKENNPLPRGLRIRSLELDDLTGVEAIVKQAKYKPIIYNFSYEDNKLLIERINSGTKFIKKSAAILTGVFVLVAILVTLNTIQMAIYSRKDEIEIMRLVGASQAYVRVPFYLEGALYGLISAILSFVLVYFGAKYFSSISMNYLRGMDLDVYKIFMGYFWEILLAQVATGIILGVVCSSVSIRKYVRI